MARLAALGWRQADLQRALTAAGAQVSTAAISQWLGGSSGIADRHKPTVARVLGVPLEELALAAAGLPSTDTSPQHGEAA